MTRGNGLLIAAAAASVALLAASGCVSSKKYVRLQSEEAGVKKDLSQAQAQLTETGRRLGDAEAALSRTKKERDEVQSRLSELQASASRTAQRADQLDAERDRLAKANDELSKSLTAKQDQLSGLVSKLQGELEEAKKSLAQAQSKASDYEAKLREANSRLDQGAAQASAVSKERDQLRQANAELSRSLGAKQDELSRQVSGLSDDKRTLEARVAELSKAADELKARQDRELSQTKATYESLMGELRGEVEKGQVKITQMAGKLSVNVADTIFFDSGKAEIKESGRKVLHRVGDILSHLTDKQIRIEGHTDDVPIRGALRERYPSNWELSTARATTVARFLQEKAGVDPSLLTAAGYGPYRPIASNEDEEGRAKNRRIEIVLIDKDLGKSPTP